MSNEDDMIFRELYWNLGLWIDYSDQLFRVFSVYDDLVQVG